MPWKEKTPVELRAEFVDAARSGLYSMSELCDRYGVSRKTGYKWLNRFEAAGAAGLKDRSRAPLTSPQRISAPVTALILEARRAHPTWGPHKVLDYLHAHHEGMELPAVSTAGDLMAREGLTQRRVRRRRHPHPGVVEPVTQMPNDIWTVDFKGHFRTQDGIYCYPLTVLDLHTRFLLSVKALLSTQAIGVIEVFNRLFREFGLPRAIRSDNGVPFATVGVIGASELNVRWMRLGIQHQRTTPASPQENGAHERMHRTMKAEATRPPKANLALQQVELGRFGREYNEVRPHQALGGVTPASLYEPSPRRFNGKLPEPEYPGHFMVKRTTSAGTLRLRPGKLLYIGTALRSQHIGFEEVADGVWSVYFAHVLLGRVDERESTLRS